ncbi:Gfo/Idh/MocA family protein [Sphingomonas solaris]|uniref:Gfo/Idh/MocA family oxidoreductase n=1 Tax=Alterirhizorhabdus solaris TaxID=2529389 RepID=A0A558QUX5_9SPHN|nr:Gfo/Idh/MocA family oxidoreductase [Sphingomonas solaris]TVV70953.1 Gfo/Idh/MocA family oxidoreductase [Sphingomonas solaris]
MRAIVIGTGFGARVVAPTYESLGIACTVVSPHDDAAVRAACAERVDLVSVHSPPFLHHAHVMAALDHGHAVLCDKPFGRDAPEARAMRDRARALGVLHFLNFEFRQQPARVRLKALLDEGRIGMLRHVGWSVIGSGLRGQKHRWLFEAEQAGGWLGAYGSHAIDTLRFLTGSEVAQCSAVARTEITTRPDKQGVMRRSTAEDAFSSWMRMENGCTVAFDTAYSAPITLPQRLTLLGSDGVLELVDDRRLTLRMPDRPDESFDFTPPDGDPHIGSLVPWLERVAAALRDGRQIAPDFDDGVAVAETMDAMRASFSANAGAVVP